jgi:hypothetical protein
MKYAINTHFINKNPKDPKVLKELDAVYKALNRAKTLAIPAQSRSTADTFWIIVRPSHKTALTTDEIEDFIAGTIKDISPISGLHADDIIDTSIGNEWEPVPIPTDKTSLGYLNGIEYATTRLKARELADKATPQPQLTAKIIPATHARLEIQAPPHWESMINQAWMQAKCIKHNGTGADEEFRFKETMVKLINHALTSEKS